MKTIWLIAGKDLRQRLRDRSAILLALILPLALAFLYNLVFGSASTPRPFRYAVVDLDQGQAAKVFTGEVLVHIQDQGYIEIRTVAGRQQAWDLTDSGDVDAAFIIPQGFPQSGGIEVLASPTSQTGSQVAASIARSFTTELDMIRLSVAAAGPSDSSPQELARRAAATVSPLTTEDVSAQEKILSLPTYFAAGMAVFFLFFSVQYGVTSLLEERQQGTLTRLLAAPVAARAILAGKLVTSFILGVLSMTVLVVASALLMGASWGNPAGVAILIAAGVFAATGVTALVASITSTPEAAGSWQSIIAIVLGLLGGAFFPVSQVGGYMTTLSLITPHAWFLRGLGELAGGAGALAVLPAGGAMLGFGVVTLGIAMMRTRKVLAP